MKTIYLVRHGESESNASGTYNTFDSPLSEKGRKQAGEVAERCATLPVEVIVSSPILRARDTAEIIGKRIGKSVEFCDSFVERRAPSSLRGKARDDRDVRHAMATINENLGVPGYRYEDAENFEDLKTRAIAGLKYLEQRSEGNILVVTHGFFMNIIAALVIFGPDISGEECRHILRHLQVMKNTALTILRLEDSDPHHSIDGIGAPWQLYVWNDHAHLG